MPVQDYNRYMSSEAANEHMKSVYSISYPQNSYIPLNFSQFLTSACHHMMNFSNSDWLIGLFTAVVMAMPQLYESLRCRLRTPEQGADTVIWLAVSPAAARTPSGKFFQGRSGFMPGKVNVADVVRVITVMWTGPWN